MDGMFAAKSNWVLYKSEVKHTSELESRGVSIIALTRSSRPGEKRRPDRTDILDHLVSLRPVSTTHQPPIESSIHEPMNHQSLAGSNRSAREVAREVARGLRALRAFIAQKLHPGTAQQRRRCLNPGLGPADFEAGEVDGSDSTRMGSRMSRMSRTRKLLN